MDDTFNLPTRKTEAEWLADLFFITLDTVDGVTVASSSASKQALEEFCVAIHNVGRSHLARGLTMLRGAVVR